MSYQINTATTTAVIINPQQGGTVSLTIQAGLTFYIGKSVSVTSSTTSSNNFVGFVQDYSFGTGSLTINNIQNINGSFGSSVIYNVILSTPFPIQPTQAYKSVYNPIQPAPTQSYPNYANVINYASDQATYPSANYGYTKFGWNSRTSLNNPVRGFSLGHSTSFTTHLSLPRRISILTNNVIAYNVNLNGSIIEK